MIVVPVLIGSDSESDAPAIQKDMAELRYQQKFNTISALPGFFKYIDVIMIPQESRRAALRRQHTVEGSKNCIMHLFHVTSEDAAKAIVNSMQMRPGKAGMLGGGIYFATSEQLARHKALHQGATVCADVLVGYSLVRQYNQAGNNQLSYEYVHDECGCNSVKGFGRFEPEYVVYRWNQVSIREVYINGSLYFSGQSNPGKRTCNTPGCAFFAQKHIGICRVQCNNERCLHFGNYHLGNCRLVCNNPRCVKNGQMHIGNCIFTCQKANCTKFGQIHLGDCTLTCGNNRCRNFGRFHIGSCQVTCGDQRCLKFRSVHLGPCQYPT